MDVGFFMRSKVHLGLWLGVPVALIALLHFTVNGYTRKTAMVLRESAEVIEVMPEMESRLASAQALLSRFALQAPGAIESAELIRKRVAEAGQSSRFSINSLSATPSAPQDAADAAAARTVTVNVSGDGGLGALIHFLNQVQGGESVVVIEAAAVRSARMVPDAALYSADFVLKYYVLGH